MKSPPVNREVGDLAPIFRIPLMAWLVAVETAVPHVSMRITETRRSGARQSWLFKQGREVPFLDAPKVTWTLDSRHRWGLAADLAMIRNATGEAIWEVSSWQWLYKQVPLEPYGLTHIGPTEWLHVEHLLSDDLIARADKVQLVHT